MVMKHEQRFPWQKQEVISIGEEKERIRKHLHQLHVAEGRFLAKGVFFDVYELDLENGSDQASSYVFKDFRSGDVIMSPEEQVALFQHQYYEWRSLKHVLGEHFFPASVWLRSPAFSDDQAHGFFSIPGKTANTMERFVRVQADRQLSNRYSSDDRKKGTIKKLMSRVGDLIRDQHEEKLFVGGIVQEKIHGLSLKEALTRLPKATDMVRQAFRHNVKTLIQGLRTYHDTNPYGAFTWHGLESENVMAEIDKQGMLTGRIQIIDANFTERPNKTFKKSVISKLEKNVFQRLERIVDSV
ncbi:hypothetical protein FJZ48_00740 [Candidatus Uhrbacteria bacterium]|nr:hypothetical protein [Candidatus Uhrbacteria bacterium]